MEWPNVKNIFKKSTKPDEQADQEIDENELKNLILKMDEKLDGISDGAKELWEALKKGMLIHPKSNLVDIMMGSNGENLKKFVGYNTYSSNDDPEKDFHEIIREINDKLEPDIRFVLKLVFFKKANREGEPVEDNIQIEIRKGE